MWEAYNTGNTPSTEKMLAWCESDTMRTALHDSCCVLGWCDQFPAYGAVCEEELLHCLSVFHVILSEGEHGVDQRLVIVVEVDPVVDEAIHGLRQFDGVYREGDRHDANQRGKGKEKRGSGHVKGVRVQERGYQVQE
jgi:hypothetical protein